MLPHRPYKLACYNDSKLRYVGRNLRPNYSGFLRQKMWQRSFEIETIKIQNKWIL